MPQNLTREFPKKFSAKLFSREMSALFMRKTILFRLFDFSSAKSKFFYKLKGLVASDLTRFFSPYNTFIYPDIHTSIR
jgi:hypothetical protein